MARRYARAAAPARGAFDCRRSPGGRMGITRQRTRPSPSPCDQFLHGFKGTPSGRASRAGCARSPDINAGRGSAQAWMRRRSQPVAAREAGQPPVAGAAVLPAASALGERPARATAASTGPPAPAARRDPPLRTPVLAALIPDRASRPPAPAIVPPSQDHRQGRGAAHRVGCYATADP